MYAVLETPLPDLDFCHFNVVINIFFYHVQTNLPIFKLKDSVVRRRYSDFEWLKNELERDSKVGSHTA